MSDHEFDYVIVGSGAGGGPLAANLAKAGYKVCVLDAGRRPKPDLANYNVPVFHTSATEDPDLGWYTYIKHYGDPDLQARDDKYQNSFEGVPKGIPDPLSPEIGEEAVCPVDRDVPLKYRYPKWQPKDGVFYPRSAAVGGCTAHHAMICVYPHNADWDEIVDLTGDWTWNPENMRRYFQELERCDYRPIMRLLYRCFGWNPTRHGFDGWLPTKVANPKLLVKDKQLFKLLLNSAIRAAEGVSPNVWRRLKATALNLGDFNTWGLVKKNAVGIRQTALSIDGVRRSAAREYIEAVEQECPQNITVRTGILVEKVLFEEKPDADDDWVATGVRYYEKHDAYEAAAAYDPEAELGEAKELFVNREVILAGGAYQTPQMLMLSGIGDHDYLKSLKSPKNGKMPKADLKVHLPGVGKNLQDRYEVGLVQQMKTDFSLLNGATLSADPSDPLYAEWKRGVDGVYATNGAVISIIKRSKPERPLPDLYIFGAVGPFRGYEPGYSCRPKQTQREFSWVILKAHPDEMGMGDVKLNEQDPLDPRRLPQINMRNFDDAVDLENSKDLESLVEGVKFVRSMTKEAEEVIDREAYPGHDRVPTHDEQKMRDWIVENAWGHHASCTCPMGLKSQTLPPKEEEANEETEVKEQEGEHQYLAVLDSKFNVWGTKNLRVVDASVFPKIPGFFIVLPLLMVSQKASEQIIQDAQAADRKNKSG